MTTVFARSDAAATIYFITQFCAASIRERRLLKKSFVNVKASFNKELRCGDLVLKQTLQLLDEPPLCYKAVPTRHLQSVSLFSSSNDTLIALRASKNAKLLWTACVLVTTVPVVYTLLIFPIWGLFMCAHATRILAAASIRKWRLFCSARPEVRQQFKSGD